MENRSFLDELALLAEKNNYIDPELYEKYNVKRGLRNKDGTGVLVGLTEIGEVHGYILDEGERIPDKGRLLYRGIDVWDIVHGFQKENRYGFEEVCYLLIFGELPDRRRLEEFTNLLAEKRSLPDGFVEDMILKAPSKDIMNKLARSVLASYSYDENPDDTSVRNVVRQSIELIARFPIMAAYGYQAKCHYYDNKSLYIHLPQKELGTAENFLHMIRPDNQYTRLEAELLDLALVLHAEHGGGNNSTFTVHVVASTGTDIYSVIAAAVGSLKGPKHGGANIKVMEMMEDIKENVKDWKDEDEVKHYLTKILRKEAFDKKGLIYGLGHAVYTLSDPRAVLLKEKAAELAKAKNMEEEFNLYLTIEKVAPEVFAAEKQVDKVIAPNVDFYSGFVYKMLNIPVELYTPIFAIARISGWCAHLIEELVSGGRIIRPAYKNVMPKRSYVPLDQR
ncbi:MAG: citrate/2-methylcitrate synthase [Thermanaeromonas sp.]|uniref:citrate/2-methylcitrate synthase n=1 Tax=Thermanaeromonas sp. TaxID=2003697 RepID=UPI00243B8B7D|nr:citrate/2-methylcitrate synthase [Thermanaeromonas sp.]MCG0278684.1 citrate/2-methylcitrate synthase [Thermanaeromonas sp.]